MYLIKDKIPQHKDISIIYSREGKLFNLCRLKLKIKSKISTLLEFQYADDNGVASPAETNLQAILQLFDEAYTILRLNANLKKHIL